MIPNCRIVLRNDDGLLVGQSKPYYFTSLLALKLTSFSPLACNYSLCEQSVFSEKASYK